MCHREWMLHGGWWGMSRRVAPFVLEGRWFRDLTMKGLLEAEAVMSKDVVVNFRENCVYGLEGKQKENRVLAWVGVAVKMVMDVAKVNVVLKVSFLYKKMS
ncbi:unnamed protein product [Vicia faba]|uniref:Uncharacterized protein n=1 Tax=Vicia faba TaxID=3906 RepID=A0AAV1AKI6_VICFA|nr:unnamed protein product [Vicia faba]